MMSSHVQVYRYDAPMGHCRASGDPHVKTFDGVFYDISATGNFIYARNLAYVPVEVNVLQCVAKNE